MRLLAIATLFSTLVLFTSLALAQGPSPPPDPCAGVTCSDSSTTCPDGATVTCSNSCSGGTCSSCTPSCAGHEAPVPPPSTSTTPSAGTCGNGICDEDPASCPADCPSGTPPTPSCGDGVCNEDPLSCPGDCPSGTPPQPGICGNGFCEAGEDPQNCASDCQAGPQPPSGGVICGNGFCDGGESSFSCPQDCGKQGPSCPQTTTCPNGQQVQCTVQADQCRCDCPLPPECRRVVAEDGAEHVFCEGQRPVCSPTPREVFDKCHNGGGRIEMSKGPQGCEIPRCVFHEEGEGGFFGGPQQCPDPRGIEQKCASIGQEVRFRFDRGCKIGFCAAQKEHRCAEEDLEFKNRIVSECEQRGGTTKKGFDPRGCEITICEQQGQECQRHVPDEAYFVCQEEKGGELVVRRGPEGCIEFVDCVHRGRKSDIQVEKVDRVPSATRLLDIALNLEELIQKFAEIKDKLNAIADYYKSRGSSDENRFRRAASIVDGAKADIDDIKRTLRERLRSITTDDIEEIKFRLKETIENRITDAVYYMLSDSEDAVEAGELQQPEEAADDEEFVDAFAECRAVTFRPEPEVTVRLEGLDDSGSCILKAEGSFGRGPGIGMTCTIPSNVFSRGIFGPPGPETMDEWQCTGAMADAIRSGEGGPQEGGVPEEARRIMEELGCNSQSSCGRACQQRENFANCRRLKDLMEGQSRGPPQPRQEPQFREPGPGFEDDFGPGGEFGGGEFGSEFEGGFESGGGFEGEFTGRIASCLGCQVDGLCASKECVVCKDCGGSV